MASNGRLPTFLDIANTIPVTHPPRPNPVPMSQQQQANNVNGNGAAMNGLPMIAGQQMDVNFLYQKVIELSEVLRENRERTQGIIAGAEELAVCIDCTAFTFYGLDLIHLPRRGQQRMELPLHSRRPMPRSQVHKHLLSLPHTVSLINIYSLPHHRPRTTPRL